MKRKARHLVKKYLVVLVPVCLSALFAGIYSTVYVGLDSRGYLEHNPYPLIEYLADKWFFVGVAISAALALVLIIGDLAKTIEKHHHGKHA